MVSRRFFFVGLGMRETVTTRLRERQRASMDIERVVEAQSGLREWSVRESDGESLEVLGFEREEREF